MKTNLGRMVALALLFMTASARALQPEVLYAFQAKGSTATDGANPQTGLTLESDGSFYGTTANGGGDRTQATGDRLSATAFPESAGHWDRANESLGASGRRR